MTERRTPEPMVLSAHERIPLFCVGSGADW
jgi:hypothetical protein